MRYLNLCSIMVFFKYQKMNFCGALRIFRVLYMIFIVSNF
jgi:hypothetical protein